MKTKIFKTIPFIIAGIILVFSFFYEPSTKKEETEALPLQTSQELIEEPHKIKEEKSEATVITEKKSPTEETVTTEEKTITEDINKDSVVISEKVKNEEILASVCTLSIECGKIYDNIEAFPEEKKALLPADGYILPPSEIEFEEGESVFDILKREAINRGIHFEFSSSVYNSAYIEGINNIYEFDCGELSGWVYTVNGSVLQYGCSEYKIKNGDVIKIIYSCALGQDIEKN